MGRRGEGKGWYGSWENRVRKGEVGERFHWQVQMKGEEETRSTNVC